ncbi:hypothetical protein HOA91_01035 [Candidatus Woesearchaeota archaeon]|jgi:hypothetical protein|nr:hypothetical protein [Candidatus Woesearchaeota archaeon]
MNKKGSLMHWTIFGIMVALGVFFFFSKTGQVDVGVKGEWSTDFLVNNVLAAEKESLSVDSVAIKTGREIAQELAENSGFPPGKSSDCATINSINLWNKEDKKCFPDTKVSLNEHGQKKLTEKIPQNSYFNIEFKDTFFLADGDKKDIITPAGKYYYQTDFIVDLGYSFQEYDSLISTAINLLATCQNVNDLSTCLTANKLPNWKDTSCNTENFFAGREIGFCVISTSLNSVKYKFALDFTPTGALSVDNTQVQTQTDRYEISVAKDDTADSYKVYYTDYLALASQTGKAIDIFAQVPTNLLYSHSSWTINKADLNTDCTTKEIAKGYLCEDKMVYIVGKSSLSQEYGSYIFAVTTLKSGTESDIQSFTSS